MSLVFILHSPAGDPVVGSTYKVCSKDEDKSYRDKKMQLG